jgi:hypothetical protein
MAAAAMRTIASLRDSFGLAVLPVVADQKPPVSIAFAPNFVTISSSRRTIARHPSSFAMLAADQRLSVPVAFGPKLPSICSALRRLMRRHSTSAHFAEDRPGVLTQALDLAPRRLRIIRVTLR